MRPDSEQPNLLLAVVTKDNQTALSSSSSSEGRYVIKRDLPTRAHLSNVSSTAVVLSTISQKLLPIIELSARSTKVLLVHTIARLYHLPLKGHQPSQYLQPPSALDSCDNKPLSASRGIINIRNPLLYSNPMMTSKSQSSSLLQHGQYRLLWPGFNTHQSRNSRTPDLIRRLNRNPEVLEKSRRVFKSGGDPNLRRLQAILRSPGQLVLVRAHGICKSQCERGA